MNDFDKGVEKSPPDPVAPSFEESIENWTPSQVVKRKGLNNLEKTIIYGVGLLIIFGVYGAFTHLRQQVTVQKVVESPTPEVVSTPASVQKPALATCTRGYQALDLEIYQYCILEGMSYVTVANIIGNAGHPVASGGGSSTVQWYGRTGTMMAVFEDDRLVRKAQSGLEPCVSNCP